MVSGIGNSVLVFTPAGAYMTSSNAMASKVAHWRAGALEQNQFWLRFSSPGGLSRRRLNAAARAAELGGQRARGRADLVAHERDVLARSRAWSGSRR